VGSTATRARPLATRCPATAGGKNWEPAAYNPVLKLLYLPTSEGCSEVRNIAQADFEDQGGTVKPRERFTGGPAPGAAPAISRPTRPWRVLWNMRGRILPPAGLAADEGDVGQVEAAHLIDAGDYLVESVIVVQFRLTQQRRVNAVEFILFVQELKTLHVPGDVSGVRHDLEIVHRSNESSLLLLEIPLVGERQAAACLFSTSSVYLDGALPLGWRCPRNGADGWACAGLSLTTT
jgi:hypothetical protein